MREYDDDSNIQHYAPVLRRIIILVAVITAVPVMLWTITAFMHTYIAQPTIPSPRPLATATAAPASPAADTATANPAAPAAAPSQPAPAVTDARATDDARGDRIRDSAGSTDAPNDQVAALPSTPSAAPAAPPASAAATVQADTRAQRFPGPAIFRAAAANAGGTGLGQRCRSRCLAAAGPDHRPGSPAEASSQRAGARGHRHTAAAGPSQRRSRTAEPDARHAAVRLRPRHRALINKAAFTPARRRLPAAWAGSRRRSARGKFPRHGCRRASPW